MRASFNQNDSCNIVLRHKMNIQCGQYLEAIELHADPFFADNELLDKNIITIRNTGCAFVNIYEVIRNSDYFKNISEIYDQIKINAIKVDVTSVDWPQSSPDDVNFVTAWDRTGLSKEDVQFKFGKPDSESPIYLTAHDYDITADPLGGDDDDDDDDDDDGIESYVNTTSKVFYCTVGNRITTYSSSLIRNLGSGSSLRLTRYLYPESLVEKSQYVPVSSLKPQYVRDKDSNEYRMYKTINNDTSSYIEQRYQPFKWNTNLPTNPMNNPSVSFKPTFLINVIAGDGPTYKFSNGQIEFNNLLKDSTFCLDFTIDVTFRGLRYSKFV
ncbi:hypothetical protein U3516DRAFT_802999 [Neocallimastix sp. 'constans']